MEIREYLGYSFEQAQELAKKDLEATKKIAEGLRALWELGESDPRIGDKVHEFEKACQEEQKRLGRNV